MHHFATSNRFIRHHQDTTMLEHKNLKQLKVIDAVIEHGSATRAANHLNISTAAVSYILKQLRKKYSNELFTRTRTGMNPGALAYALQQEYRKLQPLTDERKNFVISTYAPFEYALTSLLNAHDDRSPSQTIRFSRLAETPDRRLDALQRRMVDIDIGAELEHSPSIVSAPYLHSEMCVVVRKQHPVIRKQCTLSSWHTHYHLLWYRGQNMAEMIMQGNAASTELLASRKIACESSNLLNMLYHCSRSDHIMLMPSFFIRHFGHLFAVKALALPEGISLTFNCFLHYHVSMNSHPKLMELLALRHQLQ
ncbi:LysR family transcriptional regulator [Enterobacteriaceae bacterium 89]|nr:LysR family transcriptional regulator [Enterobacteriaceae bacterium 89]